MTFLAASICLALAAVLCWILIAFAVYALPFFMGLAVGGWTHTSGASWPTSVIAGAAMAVLTYTVAITLGAPGQPAWLRRLVATVFAVPAVFLGFQAARAIAKIATLSDTSQLVIGAVGAVIVGAVAFFKIADPATVENRTTPIDPTEA